MIKQCATVHSKTCGSWLLPEMIDTYQMLHHEGYAHSIEVWENEKLIGDLYGLLLNQVFFAKSMFSVQRDASKMALAILIEHGKQEGWKCIDCQFYTSHLASLGANEITRRQFLNILQKNKLGLGYFRS